MTFSVLIAGLGRIGMQYDLQLDPAQHIYSHARAFSRHPHFRLVGGVDPDAAARRIFTQHYDCDAHEEFAGALRAHRPDVVVVSAPTAAHGEMTRMAIESRIPSAVLCEKPLAYGLDEARAMVQASRESATRLFVNYMRRSDIGAIEIKRRLDAGEINAPLKGVAWYSKGLLHNGSHLFNLLAYWLGPMREWLVLDRGRNAGPLDREPDVRIRFERGTVVFLAAREEDYSHYTLELVSATGRLRYEHGGRSISWQPAEADPHFAGYTTLRREPEEIPSGMNRSQWHVANELARALGGQQAHLCSGAEALDTLTALHAILDGSNT